MKTDSRMAVHLLLTVSIITLISFLEATFSRIAMVRSAARYAGKNAVGVIMTGMGDDGAKGMLEMKEAGSFNIAQDEESFVVYGMSKKDDELGAVDKIVTLSRIGEEVLRQSG